MTPEISLGILILIIILGIWTAIIKAIALWKCGRNNQLAWFIVLIIFQTVGILELIYLIAFQKNKRIKRKINKKIKRVKKDKEK